MQRKSILLTLLAALLLSVMLAACGPEIISGVVYYKEFIPAHSVPSTYPVVVANGNGSTITMVPTTVYFSDKYIVYIKSVDDSGEEKKAGFYVTKETFDSVEVGDEFNGGSIVRQTENDLSKEANAVP